MKKGDMYVVVKAPEWWPLVEVGEKLIYVNRVSSVAMTSLKFLRQDGGVAFMYLHDVENYLSPLDPPSSP